MKFMLKKIQFVKSLSHWKVGGHCLSCSYTYEVIDFNLHHINIKVTSSGSHSAKVFSTTFGNSIVAMVTVL